MNDTVTPPSSSGLVERVKSILTKPAPTWDVIAAEPSNISAIYAGYVVPLAAVPAVATAIGSSVMGVSVFGVSYHTPILWAAISGVVGYALTLIMLYVVSVIINALAPSFDGQKNPLAAFKLAAYAQTPGWIAGIFGILPMLGWVALVGAIYGIYLLYLGLPKLMKSPAEKSVVYIVVIIVATIIASIIPGMIIGGIGAATGMGMAGLHSPMASTSGKVTGNVVVPGVGSMDVGKMQQAADQMAAQASAMQNGQVTVKTVDPQALLALMPTNFMGAALTDTSSSSDTAGGVAVSNASGSYTIGGGTVRLKVSDMGSMGGLAGMAQAMNVNHTENTATGYEKVSTDGGKMVSEKYDNQNKSGEYTVVYGSRISIEAEGSNVDMATIKSLVGQIDAGRAQALAK